MRLITAKKYEHIAFTNAVAFLTVAAYGAAIIRYLHVAGRHESIPARIALVAGALLVMAVAAVFVKKREKLAFIFPSIMASVMFAMVFIDGYSPHLLIALIGLCAISGAYLNLKYYLRFVLLLQIPLFVILVVLRLPLTDPSGGGYRYGIYYTGWVILALGILAIYATVRHASSRYSRSVSAMESFQTMLTATPNLVALVDNQDRVTFISEELAKLAGMEDSSLAAGRPVLELFQNHDMKKMVADALKAKWNQAVTAKVAIDGGLSHYKISSMRMKGEHGGRLIDITDVSLTVLVQELERYAAAQALNSSLAKIVRSLEIARGDITEIAKLINRESCLALKVSRVGIWGLDEASAHLNSLNYYCGKTGDWITLNDYLFSKAHEYAETLKNERVIVVEEAATSPFFKNIVAWYNPERCAMLEAAIRIGNDVVGVFSIEQDICDEYPGRREWSINEQNFVASLADLMATALAGARQRALVKQHQNILDNLPGMAYQSEAKGGGFVYTFISRGVEEISGYAPGAFMGEGAQAFYDLAHPDDREELLSLNQKTLGAGLPLDTVFRIVTKDGKEKWIWEKSSVRRLDQDGAPASLEGFFFDITEKRRAEVAEAENRAKSGFLARMSHEIRTPLNAILSMADIILREDIPQAVREHTVTIKHSGAHLLSIINDILDFSKVESGKMFIMENPYKFHPVIRDVVNIIKMLDLGPGVLFAVYMQSDLPDTLLGDEVRLREILLNVLSNAAKYTQAGHFAFEIYGTRKEAEDGPFCELVFKVKDTGIGMKPEDLKNLFTEFTQFDLEKNKNVEGTGLGLAITHSLVKLMDGNIEAQSEYGKGSEFTITLPQKYAQGSGAGGREPYRFENVSALLYCRTPLVARYAARCLDDLGVRFSLVMTEEDFSREIEGGWDYVFAEADLTYAVPDGVAAVMLLNMDSYDVVYDARDGQDFQVLMMPAYLLSVAEIFSERQAAAPADPAHHRNFTAPDAKILLVDDIETNLKVGEGQLKPYGAAVTLMGSGFEAVEAVQNGDFDLVFMDHMMPGMDGLETAKAIRNLGGRYAEMPIIALTANAIVGVREMFLQNGFNDFISKPIETEKLHEILAKWIPSEKLRYGQSAQAAGEQAQEALGVHIEGVDTAKGLSLSGGDVAVYADVLATFHKDGRKRITELAACLEQGNFALYTTYVHALKSASANVGALSLSKEAAALEEAGLKNNADFIRSIHRSFAARLEALLDNINAFVSSRAEPADAAALDTDILRRKLALLKTALEEFDTDAANDLSDELQAFERHARLGSAVEGILEKVFVTEYKKAASLIEALLASESGFADSG